MKRKLLSISTLVVAGILTAISGRCVHADVIASYDFATAAPFISSDTELNSSAGNFTLASGLSANSGRSTTSPNVNTIFTRGTSLGTTASGAVSGNDYYTFTVTPTTGFKLNLTSLTFLTDATVATGTNSYTANLFVRSSLDSFGANIGTMIADTSNVASSYVLQSVDLSSGTYQGITSPVEFRVYLFNTGANPGDTNSITRSDSYTLSGSVLAVPEPSVYLLLAGGLFLLVLGRRFSTAKE